MPAKTGNLPQVETTTKYEPGLMLGNLATGRLQSIFQQITMNMKRATAKSILASKRFFEEFPNGQIPTGIWYQPTFTRAEFYSWFHRCLNEKTGGGPYTDREIAKINDARLINDYQKGARHSGSRNLLSQAKYRKLYPHINNQPPADW